MWRFDKSFLFGVFVLGCSPPSASRPCHQDFEALVENAQGAARSAAGLLGDDYAWVWCNDVQCEVKRLSRASGEIAWATTVLAAPADALAGNPRNPAMLVAGSRLLVSTSTEAGGLIAIGQIEALEPTTGAPLARATPWEMSTRLPAPVVGWRLRRVTGPEVRQRKPQPHRQPHLVVVSKRLAGAPTPGLRGRDGPMTGARCAAGAC